MVNLVSFGQHLTIDGYCNNSSNLDNISKVYEFLAKLPDKIAMTTIIPPYVFYYKAKSKEDSGISGFVIIAESHISLHTFPGKKYLSADIFSCKEFDSDLVKDYIKYMFDIEKMEVNELNRGLEFPRNINLAKNIVTRQRSETT